MQNNRVCLSSYNVRPLCDYIESCLSAARLHCCWCCFSFVHAFSLVRFSLSSFSFIMSSSWSKNNNKDNNSNNNYQDEKKKRKESISSPLPSCPTILPHPLVTKVWLFYLRVWWFRNLNTCIPVWQRRKTEIPVSNTSLTLQGQLWKEHLSQVKDGINNNQRTFDFLLPYFPHHLKLFLLHLSRLKEEQKKYSKKNLNLTDQS